MHDPKAFPPSGVKYYFFLVGGGVKSALTIAELQANYLPLRGHFLLRGQLIVLGGLVY